MAEWTPPTRQEVGRGYQAVLNHKTAEVCDTEGAMWKHGGCHRVTPLHQFTTAVWDTSHMPDRLREGIIAAIWESGDKANVDRERSS